MIEALLVFIAMGLILGAGSGGLLLAAGPRSRFGLAEFLAYAWLFGCVFVSLATFILGQALSGTALRITVSLGSLALFVLGARRGTTQVEGPRIPEGRAEQALLLAVTAQVLFFCWHAARQYFGWDGLAVWEIKARVAFLSGGVPPAEFFADPTRRWCHQAYPLFLPLLESWIYSWLGRCDQSWIRILFPCFYASGVIVLVTGFWKMGGNRLTGYLAGLLPFFIPFVMRRDGGVLSGYADFPLSVYYVAGVIQLLAFRRDSSPVHLRMFAVICLGLPWIKDEGQILWLTLALLGSLVAFPAMRWRFWLPAAPGALMILMWAGFKRALQVPPNRDILPMTPGNLVANLDRVWPLAREVIREMMNWNHWSLLWPGVVVAVALFLLTSRNRRRSGWIASLAVLIPLSIYTSIYLFSATPNFLVHFWTSYPRLLLQIAPTGTLMLLLFAESALQPQEQQFDS